MAEIISIDGSKVKVGLDNGKMKVVPLATLTFSSPKVGDEVKVYEDNGDVVVNRVKASVASEAGSRRINKTVYILICFFLSGVGVHRFMRGQIGLGILYVLTLGLLGIGALVDFIISLVKISKYDDEYVFTSNGNWA